MISNKIPTLEAIKTLAKRIKVYIDDMHIFKNNITIKQEEDDSTYSFITSNTLEYVDNTNSLLIEFSPSNNKIDINNANLTNLAEPLENSDAATKQYVDNSISTVSAGSVINSRLNLWYNNRMAELRIFSSRVITFTDLKNSYAAGEHIKIHVSAAVPNDDDLHFTVDCDLTNYDNVGKCFYIPIIYTTINSNDLKSIMLKISAISDQDDMPIGTLLYDRILNKEIPNNES